MLISGTGSNMQAIIDAVANGSIPANISAVISNRPDAKGLIKAAAAEIKCSVIDHKQFNSRDDYDLALMECIDKHKPDLLVLAGFMRILSNSFIDHYHDRILNIHPSLLPNFKGLNTHQRALDADHQHHGASVHFVNKELDSGAVVLQAVIDINKNDDAESLAQRVLIHEHIIYPMVVQWFAEGRLHYRDGKAILDNTILTEPLLWKDHQLCES